MLNYKKRAGLILKMECFSVHFFSFQSFVLFWSLANWRIQRNAQIVDETCLISILCCPTDTQISGNGWLCSVTWHMKGSELPAFIASHFGKILPVLPVNSNMPFLWKIPHSATHNMTDCHSLWTSYSNSHCIISFPLLMRNKCNYIPPIILFPPKKMLHIASCIVHHGRFLVWRLNWVEKIAFSLWSVFAVGRGLCLRAASEHLRGLIKPPVWLLSGGKLSDVRC